MFIMVWIFVLRIHTTGLPFFPAKCTWTCVLAFSSVSLWRNHSLNQQLVWRSILWLQKLLSVSHQIGIHGGRSLLSAWTSLYRDVVPRLGHRWCVQGAQRVARASETWRKRNVLNVSVQTSLVSAKKQYSLVNYRRMWACHIDPRALTFQEISRSNGYEWSYLASGLTLSLKKTLVVHYSSKYQILICC